MIWKHPFGKAVAVTPLLLVLLGALPGFAEQCIVTNTDDSSPGSLRALIGDNNCTSIVFGLSSYPATISLSGGRLLINRSLTIAGPGAKNLAISGADSSGVFGIFGDSPAVAISGLTIRDGYASSGGGVHLENATLTLTDSVVTNNQGWTYGGGIFANRGTLNVTNSTIGYNLAYVGGGIHVVQATLNLNNSSVVGNHTARDGIGAGILVLVGTANLANSTVAWNLNLGTGAAGGIVVLPGTGTARVTLKNTLLARNLKSNCTGSPYIVSYGYNLSDDGSCSSLTGPGDLPNTTAGLDGYLRDNGGPTQTVALLQESPAVDAVGATPCTDTNGDPVQTDQRGVPRPLGLRCDIGALELGKEVVVDIKPGFGPSSINLGSEGKIPVAICSSPGFDPGTVDPYSLLLAGASVALKGKALTPMASYEHLSVGACSLDNTYADLVVHIDTQTATLTLGAVEAFVTGMTTTTTPTAIFGKDSVQVISPAN